MKASIDLWLWIEPGDEKAYPSLQAFLDARWIAPVGDFARRHGCGRVTATTVGGEWDGPRGLWLMHLRCALADGPVDLDHLRRAINPERLPELCVTAPPIGKGVAA